MGRQVTFELCLEHSHMSGNCTFSVPPELIVIDLLAPAFLVFECSGERGVGL